MRDKEKDQSNSKKLDVLNHIPFYTSPHVQIFQKNQPPKKSVQITTNFLCSNKMHQKSLKCKFSSFSHPNNERNCHTLQFFFFKICLLFIALSSVFFVFV